MHQGRSLTYRFATTAPLWLGALTGRTPLAPGETRRLASGALKYFLERGAVDDRGLLSLGWHGPNEAVLQGYSGPASPYWASKGFLGLLLPPDHEVWTAVEEPGPVEREDAVTAIAPPTGFSSRRVRTAWSASTTTAARTCATTRTTRASPTRR
jgi:hypothetical protein